MRFTLAALLALALVPAAAVHAAPDAGAQYVALGDSGAATAGVVDVDPTAPLRCVRSNSNAPTLVARQLGLELDDRTCSSAKLPDLAGSQAPGVAPQFEALGPNTEIVTLHVGANDANMTKYILGCHARFATGGCAAAPDPQWDADIDAIAPAYAAALDEISRRAPHATIIVDGWPTYLGATSCPAMLGLNDADAPYIQSKFARLNAVVAREATAHGAFYVDTVAASPRAGMCADPAVRWFDPVVADQTLLPYHPTLAGHRGVAELVTAAITASGALTR
ncbi:SGNH/GDSL hydrolase family protein [Nocardia cyriacigeorgica]|uniref:SGNH/GDSL hydrolase family protein n=1 Tax=Nocardia cyriacigeorgica TaxID=135487 RepID=A0A6P1CQ44_9NOCA|nr:SGNH/GDSL hydrolase family protein [Nocardia cyriacigeorgica]MBF6286816.1 SGNH/GDSL hydrolase family protein [Nocardia cyriacigeorgica]NEW32295.1 SGNH/GDSL hydrolase family protein [Nocardia cyriacigeorgica]